jgi:SAM-dependent methyltransferase
LKDNLCGIPGEFTIERCINCQHRFMNPRPVPECLVACYPDIYGPHQSAPEESMASSADVTKISPSKHGQSSSAARPLLLRIIPLRHIPGLKRFYNWLMDDRSQPVVYASDKSDQASVSLSDSAQPRALEIGCATGHYLLRLQQAGWQATGIEPGIRPAGMANTAGLDVYCGTLENYDAAAESFELAAAWMVLEHVPDPRETLRRLNVLLKPGGVLLFSIPNAGCWETVVFGKHWYAWELPRHLHHFTETSIRRLLEQCGFDHIAISHQRNLSYVVGSIAMMILSRWPNSRIGRRLLSYPDTPTFAIRLMLAPLAHFISWIRQGGRLTISASRPMSGKPS